MDSNAVMPQQTPSHLLSEASKKRKCPEFPSVESTTHCSNGNSRSMIVFSSALSQHLTKERLAPVSIGVRSVRPPASLGSSASSALLAPPPVYKIVTADGQERRMTAQEKKRAKSQYKLHRGSNNVTGEVVLNPEKNDDAFDAPPEHLPHPYVQLKVDPLRLAEELAEGRTACLPPVLLSPPMAQCAARYIPSLSQKNVTSTILIDDAQAAEWALALQYHSWHPAERIRRLQTDVRPLPYRVVPQVWRRWRPAALSIIASVEEPEDPVGTNEEEDDALLSEGDRDFSFCTMGPPTPSNYHAAIIQVLHPHVHISCGAKFGCHYLLYDGPRQDRHAFAGLRIVPPPQKGQDDADWPLPNAYDLAGYVRCLNTAGKLALLATTNDHTPQEGRRVLFLDLALEKIAVTTSRRPKKTLEQRLQNLAKHSV